MQMPENSHAIRCIASKLYRVKGDYLEFAAQQAIQVKRVGKVGALAVGEHFHVVDATGAHQLQDNPVAVGQGIDQILVRWLQHVVAAFPKIDVVKRAALVIAGIKRVVIAIDVENQLVKVQRVVGTILHTQAQRPRHAVLAHGKGEIHLVARLVARDIAGMAIARFIHLKARHELLDCGGDRQVAPGHATIAILGERVIPAQQGIERGLLSRRLGGVQFEPMAYDGTAVARCCRRQVNSAPHLVAGVPRVSLGLGLARHLFLQLFHSLGTFPLGVQATYPGLDARVLVVIITRHTSHPHRHSQQSHKQQNNVFSHHQIIY